MQPQLETKVNTCPTSIHVLSLLDVYSRELEFYKKNLMPIATRKISKWNEKPIVAVEISEIMYDIIVTWIKIIQLNTSTDTVTNDTRLHKEKVNIYPYSSLPMMSKSVEEWA